jgi:hypothetical protein
MNNIILGLIAVGALILCRHSAVRPQAQTPDPSMVLGALCLAPILFGLLILCLLAMPGA